MFKTFAAVGLVAFLAGGCANEAGESGESAGDADDAVVTETVVTVDAEGREIVQVRTLSQADANADRIVAFLRDRGFVR